MSVANALLIPVAASLLPDMAWFYQGRFKGGKMLGFLCRMSLEPDSCARSTQNLFHRYGARALLVGKFIPAFSTVAPPLAGIVGMGAATFFFYDTIGALVWAEMSAGVGTLFSNQLEQLARLFDEARGWLLIIIVIGLAGFIGYRFYHRRKFLRDLRMAKISVDELKKRMDAGDPITVVDVRHPLAMGLDPEAIPGALNFSLEEVEYRHHELPRDREIVLYCTCPNEISSARTAMLLKKKGIHRVRPLEGGLDAWRARNFPVDRRAPQVSLSAASLQSEHVSAS